MTQGQKLSSVSNNAIMSRHDSRSSLGAIHCPTLVLVGNEDALTPVSVALTIAEGIAGSKLDICAGRRASIDHRTAGSGYRGAGLDGSVVFIDKSALDLVRFRQTCSYLTARHKSSCQRDPHLFKSKGMRSSRSGKLSTASVSSSSCFASTFAPSRQKSSASLNLVAQKCAFVAAQSSLARK